MDLKCDNPALDIGITPPDEPAPITSLPHEIMTNIFFCLPMSTDTYLTLTQVSRQFNKAMHMLPKCIQLHVEVEGTLKPWSRRLIARITGGEATVSGTHILEPSVVVKSSRKSMRWISTPEIEYSCQEFDDLFDGWREHRQCLVLGVSHIVTNIAAIPGETSLPSWIDHLKEMAKLSLLKRRNTPDVHVSCSYREDHTELLNDNISDQSALLQFIKALNPKCLKSTWHPLLLNNISCVEEMELWQNPRRPMENFSAFEGFGHHIHFLALKKIETRDQTPAWPLESNIWSTYLSFMLRMGGAFVRLQCEQAMQITPGLNFNQFKKLTLSYLHFDIVELTFVCERLHRIFPNLTDLTIDMGLSQEEFEEWYNVTLGQLIRVLSALEENSVNLVSLWLKCVYLNNPEDTTILSRLARPISQLFQNFILDFG
ncbi:hypothetical protein HDU76_001316 [Blyttiomyces sp. JEL0837]|nr:hypothetical protein HDU76_001316 [Blyttiomyces sp. JEL0837]